MPMRKATSVSMALLICMMAFVASSNAQAAPNLAVPDNLLLNPSFETGSYSPASAPDHWTHEIYDPSVLLLWDDTQAYEGNRSVKIMVETPNDVHWAQTVAVQPNTNYRVSGWIKTENVGHTAESVDVGANLSILGEWDFRSRPLFGTNDWTYASFAFNSGERTEVTVAARLGFWSGTTTGTAWFDDLELAPIRATDPHPGWEILALIYDTVDFTHTDAQGVTHHYYTEMTQEEMDQTASVLHQFVEEDIPALDSGNMIPSLTIRYPERALTEIDSWGAGFSPTKRNVAPELDPAFDSIIVIWDPWVFDDAIGETIFIGAAAGIAYWAGVDQTYTAIIVDAATQYGHRNVFRHEWGHTILFFYEAYGTAPKPAVDNHINTTNRQYVHCPTGEPYILEDETPDNPIPNSIYNLQSGFTHDYYSGTTATPDQPARCLGITPEAWASGGPVSGPLRPAAPADPIEQIQSLRDHVDDLVIQGLLAKQRAKPLYTRLTAATKALKAGREKIAIKRLQGFVKKVKGLVRTGRLPKAEGVLLIDEARQIIKQIKMIHHLSNFPLHREISGKISLPVSAHILYTMEYEPFA